MRAQEPAPATALVDRYHLCFALGKVFEDRAEYERSWEYYERGNASKKSESRYRPEVIETNTRKQTEVCTREFFASRAGAGAKSTDPILILGLPRAGSTLLEQILASHSRVEGTQELADIQRIDDAAPFAGERVYELLLDEYRAVTGRPAPAVRERWTGTYAASDRAVLIDAPSPRSRLVVVTSGVGASTGLAIGEEVINGLYA